MIAKRSWRVDDGRAVYSWQVSEVGERLADALVKITTRLVAEPDSAELLRLVTDSCAEVLGASATGLLVADPRGGLEVIAATNDTTRFLELLQAQDGQGPCVECVRTGQIVDVPDLAAESERWPRFTAAADQFGYAAVHAIPLRLDGRAAGGLNIFHTEVTELSRWQLQAAQAFTDLAVLGLASEGNGRRAARLAEVTLTVLNDRVQVAHAIGMVAGARDTDVDTARAMLIQHAARWRMPLREVAHGLTSGTIDPADLSGGSQATLGTTDPPARLQGS
jgi:transcriptional regulator with GAF, ATPase, and Fis domain